LIYHLFAVVQDDPPVAGGRHLRGGDHPAVPAASAQTVNAGNTFSKVQQCDPIGQKNIRTKL
jgi:hypothetical protein